MSDTRILGMMIEIMHKEALQCVGLVMIQSFILASIVEVCNHGSFVVTVFAMYLFSWLKCVLFWMMYLFSPC